jgi:Brp/Blh family beta-carotene 15,15'-monooxygenase
MSIASTQVPRQSAPSRNLALVVLNLGPIFAWIAIIASLLTQVTSSSVDIGPIPAALALIALALGIPHGAADNLTFVHVLSWRGWIRLVIVYVTIAAVAALLIIAFPSIGFVLVLAMTVWHFGTGDVQATAELEGETPASGKFRILYALALGSAPVLLPLTSPAALSTVVSLEPELASIYSNPVTAIIRGVVLALIVISIVALIARGALRGAFELFTLAVLGLIASPFIAFAVYFGFWHASRHTARLALVTTGAINVRSLAAVTKIGIPSLLGFIAILAGLTIFLGNNSMTGTVLWIGLAIVWGLTVPHMWFVSRFDQRLRAKGNPQEPPS